MFKTLTAALLLVSLAAAAQVKVVPAPAGVYRSAAQYRHRQPAPAGEQIRLSDKRSGLVVTGKHGLAKTKVIVPLDSVWGYVDAKAQTFRVTQGQEFQVAQADTLTLYTARPGAAFASEVPGRVYSAAQYFFSRGLNGLIYPLTSKNLRLAYEASSPAFVTALRAQGGRSLSDIDKQTGNFWLVDLYRQTLGK